MPSKTQELKQLETRMAQPGFWDDAESAREVVSRLRSLKGVIEPVEELLRLRDNAQSAVELLAEEEDEATREELARDVEALSTGLDRVELLSLLSGPNDAGNCYFGIQAGTGGADAQDWAEMMMRMYLRYFERSGFSTEQLSIKDGEEAGILSVNFYVQGPYAYGLLSCEMGVHRMERISPFNAQGKRQTSFAAVSVEPEVDDIQIDINWDQDVREDTYRASGKGGQHVNKTSSAVRLTHLPTGIAVQCQNERSQHKNRANARKMLASRLYQIEEARRNAELAKAYSEKGQIGWGYRIRTYTLQPYQLVKDERTGHKDANVQRVLDGEFQGFIDAELRRRLARRSRA